MALTIKKFSSFLIIIILLSQVSCKHLDSSQDSKTGKEVTSAKRKKPLNKLDTIQTDKINQELEKIKNTRSDIKILSRWEFEKYEPEVNKIIGFWPECCGNKKFAYINEYNKKWGFNGIVVVARKKSINLALKSGFNINGILAALPKDKPLNQVLKVIDETEAHLFYIDEPLEDDIFSPEELIKIAKHIASKRPNALFLLASYHSPGWFYTFLPPVTYGSAYGKVLENTTNVRIMCDQYEGNQASDWKNFFESYGADKIFGHFIHSKIDSNEYKTLLNQSNFPNNAKRIFYFHGASGSPYKTPEFCNTAWQQGWLKKIEREKLYYLKCLDTANNCDKPDSKWEIVKVVKTNNFREAKRNNSKPAN